MLQQIIDAIRGIVVREEAGMVVEGLHQVKNYHAGQPRDAQGRWTGHGGGEGDASASAQRVAKEAVTTAIHEGHYSKRFTAKPQSEKNPNPANELRERVLDIHKGISHNLEGRGYNVVGHDDHGSVLMKTTYEKHFPDKGKKVQFEVKRAYTKPISDASSRTSYTDQIGSWTISISKKVESL